MIDEVAVDGGVTLDELELEPEDDGDEQQKVSQKLLVKKRPDAYLEKQWLKGNGWDEQDELFDDDFFTDPAN